MLVAVTYDHGEIFQHFGHTEQFKIYSIADGKVNGCTILSSDGQGHSALAGLLSTYQIDALICGGIGGGAVAALTEYGIMVFAGLSGSADEAALALAEGRLQYVPYATCSHHAEGHSCGSACPDHDCGNGGSCGGHTCS